VSVIEAPVPSEAIPPTLTVLRGGWFAEQAPYDLLHRVAELRAAGA
jgi:hypothetical protein